MTRQRQEKIFINNKEFSLSTEPFRSYLEAHPEIPKLRGRASTCWRGYVGTWRIRNNVLYLVDFEACYPANIEIELDFIFARKKQIADWFTGKLRVPFGEIIHRYTNDVYPMHEKEMHFEIEKGIVQGHQIVTNKVPKGEEDGRELPF